LAKGNPTHFRPSKANSPNSTLQQTSLPRQIIPVNDDPLPDEMLAYVIFHFDSQSADGAPTCNVNRPTMVVA
jgi:hypothetical protein